MGKEAVGKRVSRKSLQLQEEGVCAARAARLYIQHASSPYTSTPPTRDQEGKY